MSGLSLYTNLMKALKISFFLPLLEFRRLHCGSLAVLADMGKSLSPHPRCDPTPTTLTPNASAREGETVPASASNLIKAPTFTGRQNEGDFEGAISRSPAVSLEESALGVVPPHPRAGSRVANGGPGPTSPYFNSKPDMGANHLGTVLKRN